MNTTRFLLASKSMILTPSMALPVSRTLSLSLRPFLKFSNPIKIFPSQRCNYSSSCLLSARTVHSSPLVAAKRITIRCKVTRSRSGEYSPLSDSQHPGAQWGSRPPSEMGPLFPGCDYEHWLIVMEPLNGGKATKEEQIDYYINTLAKVVGSEEAAKKAIYNVSFERYYGFGCEIDEETSNKLEGLPGVNFVLPDSYVDVENKDYGATLLVDGKIVERSPERQRRVTPPPQQNSSRPRYNDRSRYVRRRENQSQGMWQRENQTQGSFQRDNQGPGMLQRENQGPGMLQRENQGPGMLPRENQGPGMSQRENQGPGMWQRENQGPGR